MTLEGLRAFAGTLNAMADMLAAGMTAETASSIQ